MDANNNAEDLGSDLSSLVDQMNIRVSQEELNKMLDDLVSTLPDIDLDKIFKEIKSAAAPTS